MTVGSLFSGIGGFDLGFEWAGFDIRWQVEANPFCRAVLAKHWLGVPCYDDVRTVGPHNLELVDVLIGGFPCQDVSDAGNRAGIDGDRSGLWREFARVVRELRPRVVVVENVAGLLVRGMGRVLGDLVAIGYDAEWFCLRAADVGAPHRRLRVFIIGHRLDDAAVGRSGGRVMRESDSDPAVWLETESVSAGDRDDHECGRAARLLADAECPERRPTTEGRDVDYGDDAGREETASWAAQCGADVADADGVGRGRGGQSEFTWLESASGSEPDGCGNGRTGAADVDDAAIEGLEGDVAGASDEGHVYGRVAGSTRWPRPGEPQHGWEPPRVLRRAESGVGVVPDGLSAGLVRHRRRALEALGNAVVPQVAYVVACRTRVILEAMR